MTFRFLLGPTALLAPFAFASNGPLVNPAPAVAPGTFEVDPVHSSALFRVQHFKAGYFHGRFNAVSGTIVFDEGNPSGCAVEVSVRADSVDTANPKRDEHLKTADFFNAAEFPTLSFKSKSVKGTGKGEFEVTGDLKIHGVTKPVTVKASHTGTGKGRGGELVGFETVFTVKRSDFGMNYMPGALGEEVRITIALEAERK